MIGGKGNRRPLFVPIEVWPDLDDAPAAHRTMLLI
jgi:hypothetical protein